MLHFLTVGTLLGLSSGLAPGPLLTLVISETLRHGVRSGVTVALAPVMTDLPIILLSFGIISKLSGARYGLGLISLAGGVVILLTGYDCIRAKRGDVALEAGPPRSLLKGIAANLLNPHPYLFWISVGAPLITSAVKAGPTSLTAFIGGFYLSLAGAKILLAFAVASSRPFLTGRLYLTILRFLGVLLCLFAFILFRDGLARLGLW